VLDELVKTGINAPIAFIDTPNAVANSSKLGLLLYAQTTKGHRIAATIEFEVPQVKSAEHFGQVKLCGREIVTELEAELAHGGVVDQYLADQIVIFMALATSSIPNWYKYRGAKKQRDGTCTARRRELLTGPLSLHTKTAMNIAEKMVGDIIFSTRRHEGGGIIVTCDKKLTVGIQAAM